MPHSYAASVGDSSTRISLRTPALRAPSAYLATRHSERREESGPERPTRTALPNRQPIPLSPNGAPVNSEGRQPWRSPAPHNPSPGRGGRQQETRLTCFSGDSACDTINIDAGGAFGACAPDGFCNVHDANRALTCFAGANSCSCAGGAAPEFGPLVVDHAGLTLTPSRRSARPGETVQVRAFIDAPLEALQSYQLHVGTSGGRRGRLELIAIEDRKDFVFQGSADVFDAYNVENAQMLAGLEHGDVAVAPETYLATFTYRASPDAVGTFVIDVAYDEDNGDQTFLIGAEQTDKIEVTHTHPAVITVAGDRSEGTR